MAHHPLHSRKSRCVQFRAAIPGGHAIAFIDEGTWTARFGLVPRDADFAGIIEQHRVVLDDAVARRVAAGARQPVVLRAADLLIEDKLRAHIPDRGDGDVDTDESRQSG